MIHSLFVTEPKNILDIYGNVHNLQQGLDELLKILNPTDAPHDPEMRYYFTSLIHLERQLSKNKTMDDLLTTRISQAISQAHFFSETHPQVIANLADIYTHTMGTFSYRLKVMGTAAYVNSPEFMNKIRALLLAGIRATVLWRQVGGSRLQFLFSRKAIVEMAKSLL
jgi:high frequency lysogenization protein